MAASLIELLNRYPQLGAGETIRFASAEDTCGH
jgi:hypothetical protein